MHTKYVFIVDGTSANPSIAAKDPVKSESMYLGTCSIFFLLLASLSYITKSSSTSLVSFAESTLVNSRASKILATVSSAEFSSLTFSFCVLVTPEKKRIRSFAQVYNLLRCKLYRDYTPKILFPLV